ncbi:MAG: S46 family peptidase, partial [Candidatus Acidiferrales bacterium]
SFDSSEGLVITNDHVGTDCIQKLSSAEHDYMAGGFYARTQREEAKCPDLELNVLMSLADVTAEVDAGVKPAMDAAARNAAQQAAIARIEKSCTEETGLRCDVVELYAGGVYNLYRYKKYTDVRLVFAPESAVAFYGGDPDNFTYPRYCLDISFFRVYENDRPVRTENYLAWNTNGVQEGDVVFVSGNPGSTGRQLTLAQLQFLRDVRYPWLLSGLKARLKALTDYSARGAEEQRIAQDTMLSYSNSEKALTGYQSGLTDAELMARKAADEKEFRGLLAADAARRKKYDGAFEALAKAQKNYAGFHNAYNLLESTFGLKQSRLYDLALGLVRLADESAKPNEKRLREYRDSNLESLKQDLFSEAPLYASFEKVMLAQLLAELRDGLGVRDALVEKILAGWAPAEAAAAYVEGSRLPEVEARRALTEGGAEAIAASNDTMVQLARLIDPAARKLRKRYEDEFQAVERQNGSLLAEARFATQGTTTYPEATFTLRLSFGKVKGYVEEGLPRRWHTTFMGLYEREAGREPYKLPRRWLVKKRALRLDTPYNFVSTNDIIGGNSGSPVVNRRGEFVGIIFDGNIQQLPNRFLYSDAVGRSVSVHAGGIVEALKEIYGARRLVRELKLSNK